MGPHRRSRSGGPGGGRPSGPPPAKGHGLIMQEDGLVKGEEFPAADPSQDYSIVARGLLKSFGKLKALNDLGEDAPGDDLLSFRTERVGEDDLHPGRRRPPPARRGRSFGSGGAGP